MRRILDEPPITDLWTIEGEQENIEVWKTEDTNLFNSIDPVAYFFTLQIENYTQALLKKGPLISSGEEGRETVKLIEGMYRSQREGKPVRY